MTGGACRLERGFTLLELLVAMTLLGLMLALLFGGLRTGTQVWRAGDQRSDALARIEAVHGFLRRQVGALYPMAEPGDAGEAPEIAFEGEAERLRFVGMLPAHFGAGGFQTVEVATDEHDGRRDLRVAWWPYRPGERAPEQIDPDSTSVLVEDVDQVEFGYFGTTDQRSPPDWTDRWLERSEPPDLVRLRLSFGAGDARYWPELVIHPAIDRTVPAGTPGEQ